MRITIGDIDLMHRDGIDILNHAGGIAIMAVHVFAWKNQIKPADVTPRQASQALKEFKYSLENDLTPKKSESRSSSSSSKDPGIRGLLDGLFHLAGVVGVDPRDLTVRELTQMGKPHQRPEPKMKPGQTKIPLSGENLSLLRSVFVKDKKNVD